MLASEHFGEQRKSTGRTHREPGGVGVEVARGGEKGDGGGRHPQRRMGRKPAHKCVSKQTEG